MLNPVLEQINNYQDKPGEFEINHDGEKLKLMVAYPLLGNKKNKIDPSQRLEPVTGQTDNAMGKAGKWVFYEFENSKAKAPAQGIIPRFT